MIHPSFELSSVKCRNENFVLKITRVELHVSLKKKNYKNIYYDLSDTIMFETRHVYEDR